MCFDSPRNRPDKMNRFLARNPLDSTNSCMTSKWMLAIRRSAWQVIISSARPCMISTRFCSWLRYTFRLAVSAASGFRSTPMTARAPTRAAARASSPVPVPRSTAVKFVNAPAANSIASKHSRVVGWVPVPNTSPGSSKIGDKRSSAS